MIHIGTKAMFSPLKQIAKIVTKKLLYVITSINNQNIKLSLLWLIMNGHKVVEVF